ncbi:MAG: DNA mismatch repair endonuclease MutL [candidate division WOR-3 bacterium]|nr:MAG: DNA mismatch repair endonuclease MutL [candidate division WOR-3 bacterium]
MGRIQILSPDVRGKIAAGEVIVRPSSVIKELVENSLDAQAQRIDIEIHDGGKKKCLVNDDGIGMSKDDASLAIERFATSKIRLIDDIDNIGTLGFRGEALASIAQIAYVELETSDGKQGTRIEAEAGEIKGLFDSHRPRGTRVKVRDLFFNLPARRKFLKSSEWERRLIIDTVKAYALIFARVGFYLAESKREYLNLRSVDSVEKRIRMLFSRTIAECLIPVDMKIGSVRIFGFFSRPDFFEKHDFHFIYVNSRPVKYPRMYRSIIETYQNPKNPPAFLINIIVEPQFVDVNIHPTKNQVKLSDERYIIDLLTQTIKKNVFARLTGFKDTSAAFDARVPVTEIGRFVQETVVPYDREKAAIPTVHDSDEFWQLHDMYILTQTKSGLIIIDQHVAHERIIYESILRGRGGAQRLLFPITLELTPEEYRVYKKTKEMLREMGVEFKEFSSHTVVIDSLPADAQVNREDILGMFSEIGELGNLVKEKSEIAKVVACRTAIKAGQKLSILEMQSLIDRLFACENPYTCPHGRPIILKFSLDDLASRFGRT